MSLKSVFLGHWRALEKKWLEEFLKLSDLGTVAVVTAGYSQTKRLQSLIAGSVSGAGFYPGIPKLADALSTGLASPSVSKQQSIVLAYSAGYDVNAAASAAEFFERLIDNGISAENFTVQAYSMIPPDSEVVKTAERFSRYCIQRSREHGFVTDMSSGKPPGRPERFNTYMIYGFYDLNPGQRNYIKALSEKADVFWLSPVHPSHYWRSAFTRTLNFLDGMYRKEDFHRVDGSVPLSPIAQFGENLLTGKALQRTKNICLKYCGSGTAFSRAVSEEVRLLNSSGLHSSDIAVVASAKDSEAVITEFFCSGIECSSNLTVECAKLPWGRFILQLISLDENNFHHKDLEKLLATGVISAPDTPCSSEYSRRALEKGARFGLDALQETGFVFASLIRDYFLSLPDSAEPQKYLDLLQRVLQKLGGDSVPDVFLSSILSSSRFTSRAAVRYNLFKKLVAVSMEEKVKIAEKSRTGVTVLTLGEARGNLFQAVILTGMEEGSFPGKTVNDPRMPVRLKQLLEMPSPDNRETEEAFLLRQAFELPEKHLVILARSEDEGGNPISLSPFLIPLKVRKDKSNKDLLARVRIPSSPSLTLSFPADPPFLASSFRAQRERVFFNPDEPDEKADHSGMIGEGLFTKEYITASMLEAYSYCPFAFLTDRIWHLCKPEEFPVRSEPDPLARGSLVHNCVEKVLQKGGDVYNTVLAEAERNNLRAMLGSQALASVWISNTCRGLEQMLLELNEKKWTFHDCEVEVKGTVAGYPARGRIDLIFTSDSGNFILADLKTGRPKEAKADNLIRKGLYQLPFYMELAIQNGCQPVSKVCYIHLQGTGDVTFEEISAADISSIKSDFENSVSDTVMNIHRGIFPFREEKNDWSRSRR